MMGFWDGSGISWTICKQSAPHSRQITTPTPHHRDRPKRLFLVMAVIETGAKIQLLVSAVTVTRPKLTNDLRP